MHRMVTFVFPTNSVKFAIFVYATSLWAAIAASVSATSQRCLLFSLLAYCLGFRIWWDLCRIRSALSERALHAARWQILIFQSPALSPQKPIPRDTVQVESEVRQVTHQTLSSKFEVRTRIYRVVENVSLGWGSSDLLSQTKQGKRVRCQAYNNVLEAQYNLLAPEHNYMGTELGEASRQIDMSEGALDLFRQRAKLMFESSPQSHCRTETVETWSEISLSLASRPLKLHKWPPKLPTSNLELAVVLLSLVEVPEPRSSSIFLNGSIIRTSYFPVSRQEPGTRHEINCTGVQAQLWAGVPINWNETRLLPPDVGDCDAWIGQTIFVPSTFPSEESGFGSRNYARRSGSTAEILEAICFPCCSILDRLEITSRIERGQTSLLSHSLLTTEPPLVRGVKVAQSSVYNKCD
ncbi:hypothetical protein DB88DRAFT_474874 [Papiliotrema laurentii]|uniref:Uncharacterized protein n=1 Tax=Papiliotrema laurentii TaxID=5418 RepID=A0AAD9CTJ4_PAPLA|nr:hypothetical protein DB88DRAFT_474874 [Papiliotrema laurentii]